MLEIKNLSAFYGRRKVLDNISLAFEKGCFHAVIGKNGSGKSTLVNCIAGINKYVGSITYDGSDVSSFSFAERAKRISLLSQHVSPVPFTVREMVSFGRNPYGDIKKSGGTVDAALEMANIMHLSDKRVDKISGGERQLAYFAMNLCQDADVMVFDEPTANADIDFEAKILSCAKQMCHSGKTVICVMHNLSQAVKYADTVSVLQDGKCVFSNDTKTCLAKEMIQNSFGVRRFDSDGEIFFSV